MDFIEAMQCVKEGVEIFQQSWNGEYVAMHDGTLCIRLNDGLFHPWTITATDLANETWDTRRDG